ncbi:hypothetical protein BHE90_016797 [Fusarium euwallaceae]|uniref:Protein kinase domain-containing protein n=1 Tax=Fusarium euwallaceae TaxID=1147111 RepID=A0A430KZF2_9HYPO|nr:hypothetical protein BHE90_016797 [Fusarium euwallaceae]
MTDLDPIDRALAELIPTLDPGLNPGSRKPFSDSIYPRVSRLLELKNKETWSLRPRTYTVLRLINRLDAMNSFVSEGLYDISLPYSERMLPDGLKGASARAKFIDLQGLVLSEQAAAVESGEGRHRHFAIDGDNYFTPIKPLGKGGFGEVDLVWSRLSRNEFARKRMLRGHSFAKNRDAISAFERELETLKQLSHHHLVKFMGSYTDPKYVGLIMSPVAQCNLAEYLETVPFPNDRRFNLRTFFGCVTAALVYLHEHRIRHKDLKPSNILVHMGKALITDFGTALDWKDRGRSTTDQLPMAITPRYSAPEVLAWQPRNSSADVYSLGVTFLEMFTVLRGDTMESMDGFYQSQVEMDERDNIQPFMHSNAVITESWLKQLSGRPNPAFDNEPVTWIQSMLQPTPGDRPTAFQLLELICASKGDFCGNCCSHDGEYASDSSYEGSILDEGISSDDTATRLLGDAGYDTRSWRFDQGLALRWAAGEGSTAVVRLLLNKGAPARAKELDGWTALHAAASRGHVSVVKLLLEAGADIDSATREGWTAMLFAARAGHTRVAKLLLRRGARVMIRTDTSWTALHWASRAGHEEIAMMLLHKGADIEAADKHGHRPLHLAARQGHVAVVQLLVDRGADREAKDKNGRTALKWALDNRQQEVAKMLWKT